jgi:hypothetical protein
MQAGMIPLFVGSWLQALSYNATGYASPKEWYWLTQQLLLILTGVLLLHLAYRFFMNRWLFRVLLASSAAGVPLWFFYVRMSSFSPYGRCFRRPYGCSI